MLFEDDEVLQDVEIEPLNQPPSKKKTKVKLVLWVSLELFLSAIISFCIFYFSNEISTFFAYVIIFLVIGCICCMTSIWSENKKLRTFSRHCVTVTWGICTVSVISFLIWYH